MARRHGHTEEQILTALRPADGGTTGVDVCRQAGGDQRAAVLLWKQK